MIYCVDFFLPWAGSPKRQRGQKGLLCTLSYQLFRPGCSPSAPHPDRCEVSRNFDKNICRTKILNFYNLFINLSIKKQNLFA